MIKEVKRNGRIYVPKRYVGKMVNITILSDKEERKHRKKEKEYIKSVKKREKDLIHHREKLKQLRKNG